MKDVNGVSVGYYNPEICNLVDFREIINQKMTDGSLGSSRKCRRYCSS